MTFRILIAALAAFPAAAIADPATYPTPDAAAAAVVAAVEAGDRDALLAVFGQEAEDLILTGDEARDREAREDFLQGWREMNRIAVEAGGETATLYLGRDQWPFPMPLRKGADGGWRFDADEAREEILLRRIGRNEIDAIDLMRAYVRVQADYRRTDWDGDGVMEFADAILSAPGARDGLYWPPDPGAPESPIGDFMARASLAGYAAGDEIQSPEPYLGYYFRILTAQGAAAPGGAIEYLLNGNMVAGHALLAVPSAYGETGVMSFLVGEAGVVYEADLGAETLDVAASIDRFDPEARWAAVE